MEKIPLKVVTTFSGIGFQEMGIRNSGLFDMDVVATCELDIDAIISYAAIHHGLTKKMVQTYLFYPDRYQMAKSLKKKRIGYDFVNNKEYDWMNLVVSADNNMFLETVWLADKLNKNTGDISTVKEFPECDLLTFSFPCTDLSLAGRQAGMVKGETRSGLVYEVLRILQIMKELGTLPTYLMMENVDALVNKKNINQFDLLNEEFADLGYEVKWQVINGKDCGVPQNRKRVFAIYWLPDRVDLSNFTFPLPYDTGIRLKDVLQKDVDEKYYITNERAQELIRDLVVNGKVQLEQKPSEGA